MTSKALTNLLKLSTIFCCARETFAFLETEEEVNKKDPDVKFEVHLVDVEAAWSVTKLSMHTYKSFKVVESLCVISKDSNQHLGCDQQGTWRGSR